MVITTIVAYAGMGYLNAWWEVQVKGLKDCGLYLIVITQDEYDIFVITQIRGEAEDEC